MHYVLKMFITVNIAVWKVLIFKSQSCLLLRTFSRTGHLCYPCLYEDCYPCPGTCVTCDSKDYCNTCKQGFYGVACNGTCKSYCRNNTCFHFSGLCQFCEDGYFLNEDSLCDKCPQNCLHCTSADSCFKCLTGYRGNRCHEFCINCKPGTPCDQKTGYCMECDDGLSGLLCDTKCNPKCKFCQRLAHDACTSCSHYSYGKDCNNTCSSNCLDAICNGTDGACTLGCSVGYWGTMCDKTCHASCLDSRCSRLDGHCSFINQNPGLAVNLAFAAALTVLLALVVTFIIIYWRRSGRYFTHCVRCQCGAPESTDVLADAVGSSKEESGCETCERITLIAPQEERKQQGAASPSQGVSLGLCAYYIDDIDRKRAYIVCKDPETKDEKSELWKIVWNENCYIIVMLTGTFEESKESIYCPEKNEKTTYGSISVTTEGTLNFDGHHCARRTIKLQQENKERTVLQLQWLFTFSLNIEDLIKFRDKVSKEESGLLGPVLIHSRDGVCRCGPYIALDMYRRQWESGHAISMSECVDRLQNQSSDLLINENERKVLNKALLHKTKKNYENHTLKEIRFHVEIDTRTESGRKWRCQETL